MQGGGREGEAPEGQAGTPRADEQKLCCGGRKSRDRRPWPCGDGADLSVFPSLEISLSRRRKRVVFVSFYQN